MMKMITLNVDGSIDSGRLAAMPVDPLETLGAPVILAKGYSLRGFFKMIETYPLLARMNEFFPDMLQRYRETAGAGVGYQAIDALEFGKTVEMIGFPGKPRLEIYNALRSPSRKEPLEVRSFDLSGLLDVPLTLGPLRHILFGDKVDVFEFETAYTLFEFIDGIAWELGFLTTPGECQIRRESHVQ